MYKFARKNFLWKKVMIDVYYFFIMYNFYQQPKLCAGVDPFRIHLQGQGKGAWLVYILRWIFEEKTSCGLTNLTGH
jgi:hypothetical protein